jgi:hypothetical protein
MDCMELGPRAGCTPLKNQRSRKGTSASLSEQELHVML